MAANVKKAVGDPNAINAKKPLPDFAKPFFEFGAWRNVLRARRVSNDGFGFDSGVDFCRVIKFQRYLAAEGKCCVLRMLRCEFGSSLMNCCAMNEPIE